MPCKHNHDNDKNKNNDADKDNDDDNIPPLKWPVQDFSWRPWCRGRGGQPRCTNRACSGPNPVLSAPLEIDNNSINININDNIKSCRWNGPIQVLSGPSRCSIGQHHQHKHIICVGQWTRPPSSTLFALSTPYLPSVVFSRLGALGETTIFPLSTTVKTISSAASIHLFQKKFLGELVLHWWWRSLAGKDTVIVAGGYTWSVWICCRVQIILSLKVMPDHAHQWSPQGFILIDENDLTKTRLSPLAHRTREALRPVAWTQEEKSILVKR